MVQILLGILGIMAIWYLVVFAKDYKEFKTNNAGVDEGSTAAHGGIALGVNFFDTLGIGGFAPMTALFKQFNLVHDRIIPGTLNTAMTIPVIAEAFIFIKKVEVEPITLISMLVAATLGAIIGAGVVAKLDEKKVQLYMGSALIIVVLIMLAQQFGLIQGGGEAVGLTGIKLVIAVVGNFILGALMTLGIGLYAPCMALVYALGLSPLVAFPVMMGSCAYLMPAASVKFIKAGAYNRKATLMNATIGVVGVIVAAYLVTGLSIAMLTKVVIAVVLYTAIKLLKDSRKVVSVAA
ncbi:MULTISPECIES: sulfite exporter TauE/SafE family protein [Psychrilyobacter]|uniref:Sulfite exporter TauE/SafE family protein n=1 Tax=Psychrilyobacter piezotolerans TaxID=2293438 RepID=A0ABX9KH81_9FUSO|nr:MULTISPECIES: sulfite exporter TauE/SafE family protein [Psychrilyobacter]MCS5420317.1 sulfite exporter TauE/SafE family protein [Psychrilyobacter sp. S5]NDI78101.1 sulfite exporter TauE/SafE family protein [Psychrilyobacter piezotolerans]RDE61689.1 sulfite exporter TauE/SafE family protein [Psychrilyobacter sp. S5]REI41081.1 sulfite exporter TauE/SafE family protein [Psychrilyobacter piezotolerans]